MMRRTTEHRELKAETGDSRRAEKQRRVEQQDATPLEPKEQEILATTPEENDATELNKMVEDPGRPELTEETCSSTTVP
ncbi:hypothetical protein PIB30_043759 [Stylosanthes scabra]|uniref:Uncharacterized protein n=1 Tax=Stylosanthes scabra TaxID=79078 RepID=A0ABU6ZED4_9FABA|nr:hypothetical protein [Stylosanthes scabra]